MACRPLFEKLFLGCYDMRPFRAVVSTAVHFGYKRSAGVIMQV